MSAIRHTNHLLFHPGLIVGTPGAIALLEGSHISPAELVSRHLSGDWGTIDEHDRLENDFAVENGLRIMSVYEMPDSGEVVWIITECDRSVTTLLLPEEY
jgi:hypothetical protein